MKNAELDRVGNLLAGASSAEEIFGQLEGTQTEKLAEAKKIFRLLARTVHPDLYQGTEDPEAPGSPTPADRIAYCSFIAQNLGVPLAITSHGPTAREKQCTWNGIV